MSKLLLKQVTLKGKKVDILIDGKKISKIDSLINEAADKVILGKNKTVIPGFINMHTHTAMTLMRGIKEDVPLQQWIERIWEIEPNLTSKMIYWGTKLAVLEMIKSGTTCFFDQYWQIDQAQKATFEMGIRAVHTYVILDLFDKEKAKVQIKNCKQMYEASREWDSRTRFDVSFHADYSVSPEMIVWTSEFARKNGLKVHIHLAETLKETNADIEKHGMTPVKYLDSLGVLGPEVIAAHCVWLNDEDIEILSRRKVNVVHNINSNLKLSSGYRFKYNELRDAGVNVCLGTDGVASSNNLDMLESMKTMALLQKAWREDPKAMPLNELLDVATINGAKALSIDTGRVEVGALADLVLVDTHSSAFVPDFNFEANLIYAANSSCVDMVICNGNIIMEGRKVAGEDEILEQTNKLAWELLKMS
ncbi:MAG: amidohydrolase [Bacteroidales bacterium]